MSFSIRKAGASVPRTERWSCISQRPPLKSNASESTHVDQIREAAVSFAKIVTLIRLGIVPGCDADLIDFFLLSFPHALRYSGYHQWTINPDRILR